MVKNSLANAEDMGSIPGLGRSPGEGNGNPPQCSCLENPMDRGAWWAAVYGVTESDRAECQSAHQCIKGESRGFVSLVSSPCLQSLKTKFLVFLECNR